MRGHQGLESLAMKRSLDTFAMTAVADLSAIRMSAKSCRLVLRSGLSLSCAETAHIWPALGDGLVEYECLSRDQ